MRRPGAGARGEPSLGAALGSEEARVLLAELTPGEVVRHDKGKLLGVFGKKEERVRLEFDRLTLAIWVPLERQGEAERFVAEVNAA